ncbi:NUDIX hydrolase [Streptomyces sp. NPDC004520]|uniref:NUDIX hydrolase n=1 Tax=Streptomyces sp. NPDC004520 TaxID=3364702 RepID=UPI00369CA415
MHDETPFHRIKIRVAALIDNGDEVALIKRSKNGTEQYTVPGGNVDPGEPIPAALARELKEELNLDIEQADAAPRFTWLIDAMVSRPGDTPPRKLHLVFRLTISDHVRATLNPTEHDDTAGAGELVWLRRQETHDITLFPPVPLADLATPATDLEAAAALLPALDDSNYRWI